jgi:hypothetical protein
VDTSSNSILTVADTISPQENENGYKNIIFAHMARHAGSHNDTESSFT